MPAKIYSEVDEKLKATHEKEPETILERVKDKIEQTFVNAIPYQPIQDYPRHHMCTFGALSLFLIFLFCGGVFVYLFVSNIKTQFLTTATDNSGGAICQEMTASNTGRYRGARDGYWEGEPGFQYPKVSFILDAADLAITEEEYKKSMENVFARFEAIGNQAKHNNLAQNLLYWLSYATFFQEKNFIDRVTFSGDPSVVFDRDLTVAMISSHLGSCVNQTTFITSFDPTNGRLTLSVGYGDLIPPVQYTDDYSYYAPTDDSSAAVPVSIAVNLEENQRRSRAYADAVSAVVRPRQKGWRRRLMATDLDSVTVAPEIYLEGGSQKPLYCGDIAGGNFLLGNSINFGSKAVIDINIDTRSLVTAVAVNDGVLDLSYLVAVPLLDMQLSPFELARAHYDPRCKYLIISSSFHIEFSFFVTDEGMDPIYCVTNAHENVCLLKALSNLMVPFYNHFGDTNSTAACDCKKTPHLQDCKYFFFNMGVIYFPFANTTAATDDGYSDDDGYVAPTALMQFVNKYLSKSNQINKDVFLASKVDSFLAPYMFPPSVHRNYSSHHQREKLYSFCHMPAGNCSLITFSIFDLEGDYSVNDLYYQLDHGFCNDSFSISKENQTHLIKNPYATLVQDYKTCRYKPLYVALNQLGAALGWLDALIPLAVILTFLTIQLYKKCFRGHIPDTFTADEKACIIDDLALSLLLTKRHIEMMHKRDHPDDLDSEHGIELGQQIAPVGREGHHQGGHEHDHLKRQCSFISENPIFKKEAVYQIVATMLRDEDLHEDKYQMELVLKEMEEKANDELIVKRRKLDPTH